jgi:hypothetical protein
MGLPDERRKLGGYAVEEQVEQMRHKSCKHRWVMLGAVPCVPGVQVI